LWARLLKHSANSRFSHYIHRAVFPFLLQAIVSRLSQQNKNLLRVLINRLEALSPDDCSIKEAISPLDSCITLVHGITIAEDREFILWLMALMNRLLEWCKPPGAWLEREHLEKMTLDKSISGWSSGQSISRLLNWVDGVRRKAGWSGC
jgi:hypothetical protein